VSRAELPIDVSDSVNEECDMLTDIRVTSGSLWNMEFGGLTQPKQEDTSNSPASSTWNL
jgi:hypothetical protein